MFLRVLAVVLVCALPAAAQEHPLAGKIWDVGARAYLSEDELVAKLTAATYVLLGEVHDNREHHRLQAQMLDRLVKAGRKPVVVFEQMDATQQAALDRHVAGGGDAAGLGPAVGWSNIWPAWSAYQPIAAVAIAAGLPMIAANVPDAALRDGMRDPARVDAGLAARTKFAEPLPASLRQSLEQELIAMHCGMPANTLGPVIQQMAIGQRMRDSAFADALTRGGAAGGVLIAGSGHTRTDRGVPWVLRQMDSAAKVAGMAFFETVAELTNPDDYTRTMIDVPALPFDYVWFTRGGSGGGGDPCR